MNYFIFEIATNSTLRKARQHIFAQLHLFWTIKQINSDKSTSSDKKCDLNYSPGAADAETPISTAVSDQSYASALPQSDTELAINATLASITQMLQGQFDWLPTVNEYVTATTLTEQQQQAFITAMRTAQPLNTDDFNANAIDIATLMNCCYAAC